MSKIAGAPVVGHGIRQRPQDQSALSFIDHDPVFVVKRHIQYLARVERLIVAPTSVLECPFGCAGPIRARF
jgi:hypothetical protein